MNNLYLVNGVYLVSRLHSNILVKKEFVNTKSLPQARSQLEIRQLKNLCVDPSTHFAVVESEENSILYHVKNAVVFMLVLSQNPKIGHSLQKMHDVGKMLIESISVALN